MDTKGVLTPTLFELTQEDNLTVNLFHGDIVILDERKIHLHLVQLMIVRCKECTRMALGIFVKILYNRPGYRDTVVSTRTSP